MYNRHIFALPYQ